MVKQMLLKYSTLFHIQGFEGPLKYTQENRLPHKSSQALSNEVSCYFSPNNLLTLKNKAFLNVSNNLGFLIM